jgi:uncharacterized membrane protein
VNSRWLSPIALGLAVASRQPAWFVVPFYVVAIWLRQGPRKALRRAVIVAVTALIPNLPFIVDAPDAFLDGVTGPMLGAFAPYGVGFVRFGVDGALPLLPREFYAALSAAAFVILIVVLVRYWRQIPVGALVFPYVPLYLAWRSLQNYFGSVPLLALAGDDEMLITAPEQRPDRSVAPAPVPALSPAPATSRGSPPTAL